ncbi:hypothetical protein [Deinococcus pimensis]|uniref:hypothetical protein n=1 Tax=Deinococcus pimensis TaxID=309888 RepID=UPI000486E806|nr:hypothetical protein [Deinococcus pimensis]
MNEFFVVESVGGDVVEVEFDSGLRSELPAAWLPGAAEEDGYRVEREAGGLRFVPDPRAAHALRERHKQTLLDFSDKHDE